MPFSRRDFIITGSKAAAVAGLTHLAPGALAAAQTAADDKINIALIGCRNMGFGDLQNALKLPGITCGALCDVDQDILDKRTAEVEKIQGKRPLQYKDYRKLLENKDIDAVIIGTPDHWHCLPFVEACQAGKHIYVEKPLANSIAECDLMVKAARKHQRIVQVGQQQRSGTIWKNAMDRIKAGDIGQLRKVNIWANFNYGIGQPKMPDEPVPAGVDYDRWLGPAPARSFNRTRFHGNWRMFWDYGGGLMTDWGVHLLDMALWAKDTRDLPLSVVAAGGNFSYPDHAHETFDTMQVTYQLKDQIISWENTAGVQNGPYGLSYGLAFIGNDATMVINREQMEIFPEIVDNKPKVPAVPKQTGTDSHDLHMKDFIDCIRTGKEPVCPVETGRLAAVYAHMGNIALRTGSTLTWNNNEHRFNNNTAANALITPSYRAPWKLPAL
ncbi:Gfo/Idh/MocA family oxidoreductase [Chitinophaga agrisoli]|uniref:Gfo/Idh/MocA family oxidoreductase n=1 Tax=Chitinophaga agrisoli TaxID=2607653 RepID=A0A5B2VLY9_9BACT|nr:Gfo/Idh/MocA family oxidoreductase [Chitinophaga agrisoli]KAA2239526.1 Gfo/Idh/MocA family oxidoreductase [Chitinophaga agrisoli]